MHSNAIFVSYARTDTDLVHTIGTVLRRQGLLIWTDQEIKPGEDWTAALQDALSDAGAFVLIVSPDSLKSPSFNVELGAALSRAAADSRIKVVPVLTKGVSWDQLPEPLRRRQGIDMSKVKTGGQEPDIEDALIRLLGQAGLASEGNGTRVAGQTTDKNL